MERDIRHRAGGTRIDERRRRLLRCVGGLVIAGSAAGCTEDEGSETDASDDDEEPTDPADGDEREPAIALVDVRYDDTTITEGDQVDVEATLENDGDRDGTFTLELLVDDAVVASEEVSVAANDARTVPFHVTFEEPGDYEVSVDGQGAETVTVEPEPAEFEVREASVGTTAARTGEAIDVTATVANTGGQEGTFTAELEVDGAIADTQAISVGPDDEERVQFTHTFAERGDYEVSVSEADAGMVTVEACETVVDETITVGQRGSERYVLDLADEAEITIEARTETGRKPTLTVTGPSEETIVEPTRDDPLRASVEAAEGGTYHVAFENTSLVPFHDGTWTIGIDVCSPGAVSVRDS